MQLWAFINYFTYWKTSCHTLWTLQSLIICIFHYFMSLICSASTFTVSNTDFVETSNKSQNRSEDYFRRDLKHTLWISIQPPLKTLSVQTQMDCYGNRIPNTRFVTNKNLNYWWTLGHPPIQIPGRMVRIQRNGWYAISLAQWALIPKDFIKSSGLNFYSWNSSQQAGITLKQALLRSLLTEFKPVI